MTKWFITRLFSHKERISLASYYELVQSIETEIEKEKRYITRIFIISLLSIILSILFFIVGYMENGLNKKEAGSAIATAIGGVLGWISTTGDKLQKHQDLLAAIKKRFEHYKVPLSGEDFKTMAIEILKSYKLLWTET